MKQALIIGGILATVTGLAVVGYKLFGGSDEGATPVVEPEADAPAQSEAAA